MPDATDRFRIAVPASYGPVSEATASAYGAWMWSVLARAAHMLDCGAGCDEFHQRCPAGVHAVEAERSAWRAWHVAYRGEAVSA